MGPWHPCLPNSTKEWPDDIRYDLILQLVPVHDQVRALLAKKGQEDTIIVGGLNVGYGHHEERLRMSQGADHTVINNRDCWERLGRPEGYTWISNGVDRDIFKVALPLEQRNPRVLWTGCEYHIRVTNIKGWHAILVPLAKRLAVRDIPTEYRRVDSDDTLRCYRTQQMVDWYNSGTIILCASSSEGTPNPLIEGSACGCVPISTRVGNMPELIEDGANGRLVERTVDAFEAAVVECSERYLKMARAMQEAITLWHWRARAGQYYDLFRRLIDSRRGA